MNQVKTVLKRTLANIGLLVLLVMFFVENTAAQVAVEDMEDNSGVIYRMKITPAAAPSPLFKYRFSVMPRDTIAANAATLYLRSFGERSLSGPSEAAYGEYGEDFYDWQSNSGVPIEKLLETSASEASKMFDNYISNHIERATKCRYCDWGLGEEGLVGTKIFDLLLPSVQETRSISRALSLQTRVAIAEKRFDRAVELMRMNYRVGQNVSKMKFLVCTLVGVAEVGITNGTMIDFIAAPDSPNMYWALTELPRPIIDVREAFRLELTSMNGLFPELFSAEETEQSVEAWKSHTSKIVQSAFYTSRSVNGGSGKEMIDELNGNSPELTVNQLVFKLAPVMVGLAAYREAKQQLLDDGEDAQKVEARPVAQVIAMAMARDMTKRSQEMERWIYQPFDVAEKGLSQEEETFIRRENLGMITRPGEAIASMLLPAGQQVHAAQMRIQRDIDAMRVIEAIRMHAAQTGTLPATLDQISVVPVPVNPATNEPFSYQLKGDTATLELPRSDGITYSKRFEIRL